MTQNLSQHPNITEEFSDTFDLLENTQGNVFISGKAGTGKSTFLQYFRKKTNKNTIVAAPTGIAALNVRGQTIHSLFRFKPGFIDQDKIKADTRAIFKELDLLIIDEISMVRADVFEGIDYFLKRTKKNKKPFGGIQVCIIGDLFQLSPVVTPSEKELFTEHYESAFFFTTKAFKKAKFKTIEFDTIHRQQDTEFIHLLNTIRTGNCPPEDIEILNRRCNSRVVPAPGTLVLTTTNAIADQINLNQLNQLTTKEHTFKGKIKDQFGLDGARLPAPDRLCLKTGAQVMFTKNDSEGRWVNGTVGIVKSLGKDTITVKVNSLIHEVEREQWKRITYEFNKKENKISEKTAGSFIQFPLQLAWAITIHRSQGKTLERVIINLGRGAFAAGQLYVALSRCKSLAGIALKQPIAYQDMLCDPEVISFMNDR